MKPFVHWCIILTVCTSLILTVGCITGSPGNTNATTVTSSPVSGTSSATLPAYENRTSFEKAVADANNQFGLDFYRTIRNNPDYQNRNLFFSPYSISTAFSVTYEGARGQTASEIQGVFHFPQNDTVRRLGNADLYDDINSANASYTLKTANALWAEKTYPFLPEYVNVSDQYYHAKLTNLDFNGQPEASRATINNWVEMQTDNKIQDLLPPGSISPNATKLVITNAVYFKGTWQTQFNKSLTTDAQFTTGSGQGTTVPMMQIAGDPAKFRYMESDTFQALELPYTNAGGKPLSMLIVLPKGNDLTPVEENLDLQQLAKIKNALSTRKVDVYIPRFTLEQTYSLPATLSGMGMPTAFGMSTTGASPDFSGMDGTHNLYIGDAIHKSYVDVDEEGTEAAAATAVTFNWGAVATQETPVVFRADHPFIFLIEDTNSGNILFMGRVVNPSAM